MVSSSPLFSVTIRDGSEDSIVYNCHNLDSQAWVLLSQFGGNYYIYVWNKFTWKPISRDNFIKYRQNHHSLEIKAGLSKSEWQELSMSSGRAAKRIYESEDNISKARHCSLAELGGLSRFIDGDNYEVVT